MYRRDQPELASYARQGPNSLARVAAFALMSVRQPFYATIEQMRLEADVRARAWGNKLTGLDYLAAHKAALFDDFAELDAGPLAGDDLALAALELFCRVPGLGLVKSGFVVQITFGLVGCLDGNNCNRFDVSERLLKNVNHAFKRRAKKPATRQAHALWYIDLCAKLGGSEALWNGWCEYLAARPNGGRYRDADHVSRLHAETIIGSDRL